MNEAASTKTITRTLRGLNRRGWTPASLGQVLRRHHEIIHPGDRTEGAARFVGLEHIEPHTGRRIGEGHIELATMTGRKPTFRIGQIVYGYLRPYLNKVWIAEFDGCSSVDQFAFAVNADLADTMFVAAFMRSELFLERAKGATTPGQLPRISIEEIEAVTIELPRTLAEQRHIASEVAQQLSIAASLHVRCREQLAAVEALPASILRAAFGSPTREGE